MKSTKIIGILFFAYAIYTIVGMVLNNDSFWLVYNIVTLIFSISSGIVLLKQK